MCARRSGNILFYFFLADNFTGSKDTEPYKMDVSFCVSIELQDVYIWKITKYYRIIYIYQFHVFM